MGAEPLALAHEERRRRNGCALTSITNTTNEQRTQRTKCVCVFDGWFVCVCASVRVCVCA